MHSTFVEDNVWRTAAIVDRSTARRCIGRLADFRIDYQVIPDDRHLRILVPRTDLEKAVNLVADVAARATTLQRVRFFRVKPVVLFAIPLGAISGSILSYSLSLPLYVGNPISAASALLMAGLFSIDWRRGHGADRNEKGRLATR